MKRISGIIAILAAFTGASSAAAGECNLAAGPITLVAYNDTRFSNFDGFVAALDESREHASTVKEEAPRTGYRNIHTFESFMAMLGDDYDASVHKNVKSSEGIFPALSESYSKEKYQAVMDRSRFTALKDEGCGSIDADLLSNPDWAGTGCI